MFLRTLGELSLDATGSRRQKPLLLLAYLAIQGPSPRASLATLFWSDATDARDSLSSAVRRLNALSADLILAEGELLSTTVECDAVKFMQSGDHKLYQGPFMHGLELVLQEEAEEWLWTMRERIADQARRIRLESASRELVAGNLAEARNLSESCLDLEHAPAWDSMDLLELTRILRSTGSSRLPEAHQAKGTSVPAETDSRSGNLPSPSDAFIGRTRELRQIVSLLSHENARLVTVHGTGGSGKSRLAVEAASHLQLANEIRDGAWFVPLETVSHEDSLAGAIAQVLQLPAPVSAPMEAHVLRNLARRNMLLVLDNFEHLVGGIRFVADLLESCPSIRILVTSRVVLNLTREHVVAVDGLPLETDAVQLLTTRMAQRAAASPDSPEAMAAARKICSMVAGQPLAIELAASLARFHSLKVLASGLERDYGLLVNRDPTVPDRQRSIEGALDVSWQLLSEVDREAMARTSVFEAGFMSSAALDVGMVAASLERLVEAALLRCDSGGRFSLHPLVKEFARRQLERQPELAASARADHASHYLNLLRFRAHEAFGGPTTTEYHGLIRTEFPNIVKAWEFGVSEQWWPELADASLALGMYATTGGDYAEFVSLLDHAVQALEGAADVESHRSSLGRLLGTLAYPLTRLGQNRLAIELSERAVELLASEGSSDQWGPWCARQAASFAYMAIQEPATALGWTLENTRIPLPDDSPESRCIWNIATGTSFQVAAYLYLMGGQYQEALDHLQVADGRMQPYRAPFYSHSYWTMGMILLNLERAEEASKWLERGIEFANELGMRNQQGFIHLELGRARLALGDTAAAVQNAEEALTFGRLTSDAWLEQDAEALLGIVLLASNDSAQALPHLRKSIRITTNLGLYSLGTAALIGVAKWLQVEGHSGRAIELLAFTAHSETVPVPARRYGLSELDAIRQQELASGFEDHRATGMALSPQAAFELAGRLAAGDSHDFRLHQDSAGTTPGLNR